LNLNLIILLVIQILTKLWLWTAHTYKASSSDVLIALPFRLFTVRGNCVLFCTAHV
jgi:hypothetical protein